jgi:very-short-patch-repair endonuclease
MTDAERKLWSILRGRQIDGLKFRRQHPFENYILDFVCLEEKLVVEVDGGQHQNRLTEDNIRSKVLEEAGFRVLRFWNHEVLLECEAVAEQILQEVSRK